jgi:DNA-binding NarL/FixJ family response regulator
MIKILLADAHKILRAGIISFLKNDPEIEVVGDAGSSKEIIEQLSTLEVDIVVLDNNIPELNGLETTRYIKENFSHVKVLALSIFDQEEHLITMFEAGASGYILKKSGKEDLVNAIKKISEGNLYICSEMALGMLQKLKANREVIFRTENKKLPDLSKRELEILHLIGEGYTNNQIADKTFTSRRTVETHRKNLIEKTDSKNTATLIKYAIFNNIICS